MKRLAALSAALVAAATLPLAARAQTHVDVGGLTLGVSIGLPVAGRAVEPIEVAQNGGLIPLPRVINRLRKETGGEYVSANVMDQGGRTVYWIRMRHPGGRFVDYVVDAQTGQILSEQGG